MSDFFYGRLYAQFWARGAGTTMTARGAPFDAISAQGTHLLNGIGSGKVSIPVYSDQSRTLLERIQPGDVCTVWSIGPDGNGLYITTFIVDTRTYKEGVYEISGADFLAELQEYVAISPVGQLAEVVTSAVSLGTRRVGNTDEYIALEAAYFPYAGNTQDITRAGKRGVLFTEWLPVQVTDAFLYTFADGETFQTTVTAVSDGRTYVEIEDELPQDLPAAAKVNFYSTRVRVADGSVLEEGSRVYYTPAAYAGVASRPTGNFIIERIELGDGDSPDYIYSADPISDHILAGATLTQHQYTSPTDSDVEHLLLMSTFGEWDALRGDTATTGSAYAPNAETVYDVLLAIADITKYKFRRYTGSANSIGKSGTTVNGPIRRVEYFAAGDPPTAGEVLTLGTENRTASNYGEILSLETENANTVVSHLIPYGGGGGSGRFDFRQALIGDILDDYPDIQQGIVNGQYYIYNTALDSDRAVWHVETFSHISPLNPSNFESRREAANQLLRAACEWLLENAESHTTYSAEVFTLGEPRPGDVVSVQYNNIEPGGNITGANLSIVEVHHEVTAERQFRTTRLVMNATGSPRMGGENALARSLLDLQRVVRHSNFGARGDARIAYDSIEFGNDADVTSRTGDLVFRSVTGDMEITSETGDVNISGQTINLSGSVVAPSVTVDRIYLEDEGQPVKWDMTAFTLRNIPRARLARVAIETGG